jgi:DNA-binding XRE family transcriptional regulator
MSEIAHITGRQFAAARALASLDQTTLAKAANISIQTLRRIEAAEGAPGGYPNNITAVIAALAKSGIEFEDGIGVRLKKK